MDLEYNKMNITLTDKEKNEVYVSLLREKIRIEKEPFKKYFEDRDGLLYGEPNDEKEWKKSQKIRVKNIQKLRKKFEPNQGGGEN